MMSDPLVIFAIVVGPIAAIIAGVHVFDIFGGKISRTIRRKKK